MVVVGGGPAGAIAARFSALHGASTLLLEEHASIGSPVQCTGLISTKALRECELAPESSFICREIRGAKVYSPGGYLLNIDGGRTKAYVVDRKIFDRALMLKALDAGVDLMLRARAVGLEHTREGVRLWVQHCGITKEVWAGVVIGADGVQSRIARMCGLDSVERCLSGIQIEGRYEAEDADFVEIFLGNSIAPGFFAWAVPASEGFARIGLCTYPDVVSPYWYLQRLLSEHQVVSRRYQGSYSALTLGGIPLGAPQRTCTDSVLIVGDAAGQVKPTSGGGIYMGAVCAKIAGEVAASGEALELYDDRWRGRVGRELLVGMYIHDMLGRLSDVQLDEFVQLFNNPKVLEVVKEYGDMDYPSVLFRKVAMHLNKKQLFAFTGSVLRNFINL